MERTTEWLLNRATTLRSNLLADRMVDQATLDQVGVGEAINRASAATRSDHAHAWATKAVQRVLLAWRRSLFIRNREKGGAPLPELDSVRDLFNREEFEKAERVLQEVERKVAAG